MLRLHVFKSSVLAMIGLILLSTFADAQEQGRRGGRGQRGRGGFGRGFGGFGGGVDMLRLARHEKIQKEVEMLEDQVAAVQELAEEQREAGRGRFGRRGGANPRELSQEERQEMFAEFRRQIEERAKQAEIQLTEILLPHQFDRIKEIQIQAQGVAALQDSDVAAKLKITDEQKGKLETVNQENQTSMREQMTELFRGGGGGGDREALREKMDELRKEADGKVLAVLTAEQKTKFEEMKGAAFEMPEDLLGRGGRGGFGRGGRGGNRGGNRPDRPARPEA